MENLRNDKKNLDGKDNYVWLEATGRGHYVGVTMSVLQTKTIGGARAMTCFSLTANRCQSIQRHGRGGLFFLGAGVLAHILIAYA